MLLKNLEYFILGIDSLYTYVLAFLDLFSSRLLYCSKVLILLINDFSSCIYGNGKATRCPLVHKATLRHTDHSPYHVIILENKGRQFQGSDSKTEKPQFDKTITITCSLCLKSQTEEESCAVVPVIKYPRDQNTFCLDNPGNSDSSARVSHFRITQGTRNPNLGNSSIRELVTCHKTIYPSNFFIVKTARAPQEQENVFLVNSELLIHVDQSSKST